MKSETVPASGKKSPDKAVLQRKRKIRKLIVRFAVALAALIIILLVLFFVLFRVRSFRVEGSSQYTTAEFTANCGISTGDNLLLINTDVAAARIAKSMPYADNVKVTRKLPSTVVISADQAAATYTVIMSGGLYVLTNEDMKVLEVTADVPAGSIIVEGHSEALNYEIGSELPFTSASGGDDVIKVALKDVSTAINENELDGIEYINIEDSDNIYLIYDDRIIIKVGDTNDITKKIALAKKALDEENQLSSSQYGEMNVTATKKAIFAPKDYKDMADLIAYDDYRASAAEAKEETEETDETAEQDTAGENDTDDESTDDETTTSDGTE